MGREVYTPTRAEVLGLKVSTDMFKVSGDTVFATRQGEGMTAGMNAVFFRLHFCNLECGKLDGWQCDTGYTWDTQREELYKEPVNWSVAQAAGLIEGAWREAFDADGNKRVVVTGGEPLIQQQKIVL